MRSSIVSMRIASRSSSKRDGGIVHSIAAARCSEDAFCGDADDRAGCAIRGHSLMYIGAECRPGATLTTHQNFPSFFVDRWNLGVIQRVLPNQRVEIRDYGWWDRGSCRVGLG